MKKEELKALRDAVLKKLKAFQRATVARIDRIYRDSTHPQNRVLVADEVGLGKTMVAKGVIANMAVLRDEEGDKLFKVIYVCSNQAIARQNIKKLCISEENLIDTAVEETRLSMQHLRVLEQEIDCMGKTFVQLIPLTPGTSFQITNCPGSAPERALAYCVLSRRIDDVEKKIKLSNLLRYDVNDTRWNGLCGRFENRIKKLNDKIKSNTENQSGQSFPAEGYPDCLFNRLDQKLLKRLDCFLQEWDGLFESRSRELVVDLRRMFARISAEMFQPDLVIMDEFQRFHSLLNPQDDDLKLLTSKFFRCDTGEIQDRPRILLLSATPYKLYSTLEEIDDSHVDEHYQEFMEVIDFLLDHDRDRIAQFRSVWQQYSQQLCDLRRNAAFEIEKKQNAETALYDSGMCRTERLSFVTTGDFLDPKEKMLTPDDKDVLAYIEFSRILSKLKLPGQVPYEFAKSSPFLLSFMEKYKLKQIVEEKLTTSPKAQEIIRGRGKRSLVWLHRDFINRYNMLPVSHAKLECLRQFAFEHHAERLLWIPPSMPNYTPQGVFKEAEDFSKLLIFSAWEMVPRMIASLISYDAECRTNGKLCNERYRFLQQAGTRREMKTLYYFNPSRFPQKRLFSVRDKKADTEDRLAPQAEILRIVSNFLVECFSPSDRQTTLEEARSSVRSVIAAELNGNSVIDSPVEVDIFSALGRYLDKNFSPDIAYERREIPDDALDVLTDMALAAPGICVVRSLKHYFPDALPDNITMAAKEITDSFLRMFDSSEGIGAVASSCADLENYERKVLQYCVDGNFQAMFDEYCFIQKLETDGDLLSAAENICNALNIRTATYDIPTCESTVSGGDPLKMRSHYAVGFNKSTKDRRDTDTSENADRKESIRTAFNSPFRPFVLASTSVGQEGLDFHYYCRRIMHWNLPGNPTELEQREGRINRYLCLAVRNSMAQHFRSKQTAAAPRNWEDLLSRASEEAEMNNHPYSEITPYWCFSKDQPVKIERIVPLYPFSRDVIAYKRLLELLSLYRLTMGQARQEEILNAILSNYPDMDQLTKNLFISLCPFQNDFNKPDGDN